MSAKSIKLSGISSNSVLIEAASFALATSLSLIFSSVIALSAMLSPAIFAVEEI